ncbi:MAG: RcnB family protein [Novosphingobium sp.]
MGKGRISKPSGLAVLAASVALTVTPAAAQNGRPDREHGDRGGWQQGNRGGGGDGREGGWRDRAAASGQAQAQEQERSNWGNGRAEQMRAAEAQAQSHAQAQAQAQAQAAQRNQAIAEANRGQGGRDVQRAEEWRARREQQQQVTGHGWQDQRRGDDWRNRREQQQQVYRQGWQNGQRGDQWRHDQQGWRDGTRDEAWRDGNRGQAWRGDGNRYAGNQQHWNHGWRGDNRYDWSGYRSSHRDVYRIGRYRSPYNDWSYRRLSIGFSLAPLFYSSSYWIDDPYTYRLPQAYGPYRWVRYYDDALLVDIYSGEVVDTIYDIFW